MAVVRATSQNDAARGSVQERGAARVAGPVIVVMTPPGEYGSTWLEQSCQPPGNKNASKKVELFMTTATRTLEHPSLDEIELTAVLFALSDPARLDLVRELALRGPLTV